MRYAILFLILAASCLPALANEVACTYDAFITELDRIDACSDYTTAGCQPEVGFCAANDELDGGETGVTCCTGEDAGSCDAGRTITFDCGATTIYFPSAPTRDEFCNDGTSLSVECENDGDCSVAGGTCQTVSVLCPNTGPYAVDTLLCTDANTPYQCCTGNGTGNCCDFEGSTNWYITDHRRNIDYLVIDGESKIAFEMDPPWFYACEPETADEGNCEWAETEEPNSALEFSGDYNIVRDIDFNYFVTPLHMAGENQIVSGVNIDGASEDCLLIGRNQANTSSPENILVEDTTITHCQGKGIQTLDACDSFSYPTMRATFDNVTCDNSKWCMQFSSGRWNITNSNFSAGDDDTNYWQRFEGLGVKYSGSGCQPVVYMSDTTINGDGAYYDIKACVHAQDGGTFVSQGGNTFENCSKVGVMGREQTKILLEGDIIQNNGGGSDWYGCDGGVCTDDSATTDLGGGSTSIDGRGNLSSAGGNSLIDNEGDSDSTLDVNNKTTNTIKAEGNWWGADENPDTTGGKITGTVDVIPWLDAAPGGVGVCGDNTKDAGELCDGTDLDSNNCTTIGESWTGGTLACDSGCQTWDTALCEVLECGDDQVDSPEVCDGAVLPENCADNGFAGGTIACAADCLSFDTSGCSNVGGGTGVTGVGATGMGLK